MLTPGHIEANSMAHLQCAVCGKEYPLELRYRCQSCDGGVLNVVYRGNQKVESGSGLQRFKDFVPIKPLPEFSCPETPLIRFDNAQYVDHDGIYCKVEGALATGNTKYRQSCMATPGLLWGGVKEFVVSSTGNSSSSFMYWAKELEGQIRVHVFVPSTHRHRLKFQSPYATIHETDVDFVETGKLAKDYAQDHNLFWEGGFFNFFRREGLKTGYMEGATQMDFQVDVVFQPISSGMGFYGGYFGFKQLLANGYIKKMPRFVGVQQDTCAPVYTAFHANREQIADEDIIRNPTGKAEAILRGNPTATYSYLRDLILDTQGTVVAPTQAELLKSYEVLQQAGISACHTGALSLAACKKLILDGWITPEEKCLLMVTGGRMY
ncbi:MAG: pyridoxal-phosphate dependent enzyme [Moorea sp. SIO4G2]|nr:pyridoxal-phosphate dependent enzyme [Moorena sp. SIO4G2]